MSGDLKKSECQTSKVSKHLKSRLDGGESDEKCMYVTKMYLVFHGSRSVFMVFHSSKLIFNDHFLTLYPGGQLYSPVSNEMFVKATKNDKR